MDVLVTYHKDGTITREPILKPGSMQEAFERLRRGRDHGRCPRKPCLRCTAGGEHPDCPRKS